MTESLERKQEQRYAVLKHMHEVAVDGENGPEWTYFDSKSIAETLPYSEQEIESSLTHLKGEHLVEIAYGNFR